MKQLLLPTLRGNRLRAWPGHDEGGRVPYEPSHKVLTRRYWMDAHTTQYSVPFIERRLDSGAPARIDGGVQMVFAMFDADGPGHVRPQEWWEPERSKILDVLHDHDLFAYATRRGYRVVGALEPPIVIRDQEDADAWAKLYTAWCRHLQRRYGILADLVTDWTRLFRVPHGTRDEGGTPEEHETFGSAERIGTWSPELSAEDLEEEMKKQRTPTVVDKIITAALYPDREYESIDDAAASWVAHHPVNYPRHSGECPVCGDAASFGHLPTNADRWCCFSTDHPDGVGLAGKGKSPCHHGDSLDLEAHNRRMTRMQVLRADGYLRRKPLSAEDAAKIAAIDVALRA